MFCFIDFFVGIGGICWGFELFGGKCVFMLEWDCWVKMIYSVNFLYDDYEIVGDIIKIEVMSILEYDLLFVGFFC